MTNWGAYAHYCKLEGALADLTAHLDRFLGSVPAIDPEQGNAAILHLGRLRDQVAAIAAQNPDLATSGYQPGTEEKRPTDLDKARMRAVADLAHRLVGDYLFALDDAAALSDRYNEGGAAHYGVSRAAFNVNYTNVDGGVDSYRASVEYDHSARPVQPVARIEECIEGGEQP